MHSLFERVPWWGLAKQRTVFLPEGIQDLEAAFAEAAAESDEVQSGVTETAEPAVDAEADLFLAEDASDEAGDQPDVAKTADESDELMDELLESANETEAEELAPAADLSTEIEVDLGNGTTRVTIEELKNGYLRQADYTRKTQEVAAQRSDLDDARAFHDAFMNDPVEFARALAVRAELLDPNTPVKDTGAIKAQSAEQFEAAVQAEVDARLSSHPQVVEATKASAKAQVHAEFDRIGEAHNMQISADVRQSIIDEAVRRGVGDLELVFEARLARARERAADKKRASTSRPSASPASAPSDSAEPQVSNLSEAFEWALAQTGG